MTNLTKIILGLNIAAGAAGLFFGLSVIPGKVDALSKTAKTEKGKAAAAEGKAVKAESARADMETKLSIKTSEADKSQRDSEILRGSADQQTRDMATLQQENLKLLGDKTTWNTERKNMQDKVGEGTVAQAKLLTAEEEILSLQKKLKKLTDPPKKSTTKPRDTKAGFVGKITNIEPRFGYITINVGSSQGYQVKDRFKVYRNGDIEGGVEIFQLGPSGLDAITRSFQGLGIPLGFKPLRGDDLEESN